MRGKLLQILSYIAKGLAKCPMHGAPYKQVHLDKGKPKHADGSVLASDLRPISINSIWWRVICKARFKQREVQEWLDFIPDFVFGGKPKVGVMDAIAPLMTKVGRRMVHWITGPRKSL